MSPALPVVFHPEAVEEARATRLWYAERSVTLAQDFALKLDAAIALVAEAPDRWPRTFGGFRRYLMHRFPYAVVYRVRGAVIEMVAVAHLHRSPGFWRQR